MIGLVNPKTIILIATVCLYLHTVAVSTLIVLSKLDLFDEE